jgi:arylsulfatase A-like enzyme
MCTWLRRLVEALVGEGQTKRRTFVRNTALGSVGIALQMCGQVATTSPGPVPLSNLSPRAKPSFVVVVLDDARFDDLRRLDHIPVVIAAEGLTFDSAYVAVPLCTPSRVSILTGRYGHNHHIWSNSIPKGGYVGFHDSQLENQTIAVWLKQVGYRTMLAGKYLNHYPEDPHLRDYVPPGWDEWYVPVPMNTQFRYSLRFKDALGREGWEPHGNDDKDYEVDVLRDKTVDFIRRSDPFFVYVAPVAPHIPHLAAPRFRDRFRDLPFEKPLSYNENTKDKPLWVKNLSRITGSTEAQIIEDFRSRLRSLLAVDEMVKVIVDVLVELGRLDRTYIILASDNGWFLGEHRYCKGKDAPYEEASRTPLVIRGPGAPAGKTLDHPVSLVDLAPTLLELAQASLPDSLDGRSLVPLLSPNPTPVDQWRRAVLFESAPRFAAIRAKDYVYINWGGAFTELYDVRGDPYQTRNLLYHLDLQPDAEAIAMLLAAELAELATCQGPACQR